MADRSDETRASSRMIQGPDAIPLLEGYRESAIRDPKDLERVIKLSADLASQRSDRGKAEAKERKC